MLTRTPHPFQGDRTAWCTAVDQETDQVCQWAAHAFVHAPIARLGAAADALGSILASGVLEDVRETLAEQLRVASIQAGNLRTDPISGRTRHLGDCGREFGADVRACHCFDVLLELADVVLGGAS